MRIGNHYARFNEVTWAVVELWYISFKKHVCLKSSARRPSTPCEWLHTWSGEGLETHTWCSAKPLFARSWTMGELHMAQHRIQTCNNWTAFTTLHKDWPRNILHEPSLPSVQRGQWSSFGGMSVKATYALQSEISRLHWQSSTPSLAWIWPNQYRLIHAKTQWKGRKKTTHDLSSWS